MAATVEESTPPDMATATVLLKLFSTSSSMTGTAECVLPAAFDEGRERTADFRDERGPVAGRGLAEEPRGWVPGAVPAILEPAPIGEVREHDPDRKAHSASEMGDRRVHGEDEIEGGHESRGFGEALVSRRGIDHGKSGLQRRDLRRGGTELEGEKGGAMNFSQRGQDFQGHRALAV